MFALLLYLFSYLLLTPVYSAPVPEQQCPSYGKWAMQRHQDNRSMGKHQLPFQRPSRECRSFYSQEVEDAIERLQPKIKDPDLYRLFENAFPNTLDTAVRWKGFAWANETDGAFTEEDLAFIITGDM